MLAWTTVSVNTTSTAFADQ